MDRVLARELLVAPFRLLNLVRNEKLRGDEIVALQSKKLRRLVKHSFDKVPYYHKLFRASGIRPKDIRTVHDLEKIPISRKTDFTDLGLSEITARDTDMKRCELCHTSGTSGIMLEFYRERKCDFKDLLRYYFWTLQVGDRIRARHLNIGRAWPPPNVLERYGLFPARRVPLWADVREQLKSIVEYFPRVLVGVPSALRLLAIEALHERVANEISMVLASGEMLDACTKRIIGEAFDSEVFDVYGLVEIGGVGGDCSSHLGHHVWGDRVIVETSEDGEKLAPGEEGCITATSLDRYSTPFIRYDTGDIGRLQDDECDCGSQFPLIRITKGRSSDTILLNDGRLVPAYPILIELYTIQGIRQFQVTQRNAHDFVVKVAEKNVSIEDLEKKIVRLFKKRLGEVNVEVEMVDDVPKLRSGKAKQFVSQAH